MFGYDRATVNKVESCYCVCVHTTPTYLHRIGQALVHHEVEGLNVVTNQFLQCLDKYNIPYMDHNTLYPTWTTIRCTLHGPQYAVPYMDHNMLYKVVSHHIGQSL